jgi:hypothetical protein
MAGYNRKLQMSNNAVDAYNIGTKPYNEWSRAEIIDEVNKLYDPSQHNFDINTLVSIPIEALRMCTLSFSSWHHTTKKYTETDFYFVDGKKLLNLTSSIIQQNVEYVQKKQCEEAEKQK